MILKKIEKKNLFKIYFKSNMSSLQTTTPNESTPNESTPVVGEKITYPILGTINIANLSPSTTPESLQAYIKEFAKGIYLSNKKYEQIMDYTLEIHIVPPSTTGQYYGIAFIKIKEQTPGHRLFNFLLGEPDPVDGTMFRTAPFRLGIQESTNELTRLKNIFEKNKSKQTPAMIKELKDSSRSQEDYEIFIDFRTIFFKNKTLDEDAGEKLLIKYADIIERRAEEDNFEYDSYFDIYKILTSEIEPTYEDIKTITEHLRKTSEKISLCMPEIEVAHVEDPKPGNSSFHLMSADLSGSSIEIIDRIIRPYFTIFNTVNEKVTKRYKISKDEDDVIEITDNYPHVYIQKVGKKSYAHVFFSDAITNTDARDAINFRKKLNIMIQSKLVLATVFFFYNESMDPTLRVDNPRTNIRRSYNTTYVPRQPNSLPAINVGKYKPFENRMGEDPLLVSSPNKFSLLVGKPKANPESVWSKPLPAHIKEANENTLPQFDDENMIIPDGPRQYDPTRRDNGNLSRFF